MNSTSNCLHAIHSFLYSCCMSFCSCFDTHLDDPYHVRCLFEDSPRKYSDNDEDDVDDTDDADFDITMTTNEDCSRSGDKRQGDIEEGIYSRQPLPNIHLKRAVRSWSSALYKANRESGGTLGGNTDITGDSDASEIIPTIDVGSHDSEESVLQSFWRGIRGIMRDSIDEEEQKREQREKEEREREERKKQEKRKKEKAKDNYFVDLDTLVL